MPQDQIAGDWTSVTLERSGGMVPTLKPQFQLDVAQLPTAERETLRDLLQASRFTALPARFGGEPHPDAFTYRLTAHAKSGSHTVEFSDDDGHPDTLDVLADWIKAHKP